MQLLVRPDGTARAIYSEEIALDAIGQATITRASHVEPDKQGQWWAQMVGFPVLLGPFKTRSQALKAEELWIVEHLLQTTHDGTFAEKTAQTSGLES